MDDWTLVQKLEFANELAGRKVHLDGFAEVVPNYFSEHQIFP